jgi:perosamine synthetase
MIPVYEPNIAKYSAEAMKAIQSGWISNHGEYIELTTNKLKDVLKVKYAILMSNGTCATHCLFLAIKHKYPHINKLYVPNNVYVAAWNTSLMVYDTSQLEVMKINIDTWNIETNEEYITTLESNSAVLIVHNLGNIVNVPRLKSLRPDLIFVEDNCEGLFGKYDGIYSGTFEGTLCSSISFYGNKIITSGEGGAFLTNDESIYNYIKSVYSQGMSSVRYVHCFHSYNYRMTNVQAAFLYEQLNDLENILNNKQLIFDNYTKLLQPYIDRGIVSLFKKDDNTENANWLFSIRLNGNTKSIEDTTEFFKNNNIDIRPFFYPINKHEHLRQLEYVNDNISGLLNKEVIMIPSSPNIQYETQEYIVDIIRLFSNKCSITVRNVLNHGIFDLIDKNIIFDLDNQYYEIIRINVKKLIYETIHTYNSKLILEVGPKKNINDRIKSNNNIIETVDIVQDNNTTYVADLTKEHCIPNERFDVIYCLEVLEHTFEPWELLKNLYKLLKNGGFLHISVPFKFRIHGPMPDCYRISEYGLKFLLYKYNFKILKFEAILHNDNPAFPIHYTITCVK